MKIAYVCNEYPLHSTSGGIGTFTRTIACGLVERGHEVTVVGFGKNSGEWCDRGVRVVVLPESTTRGAAWLVNRRRLYSWLKRGVRSGSLDVIELPESHGLFPFCLRGAAVVVRLHLNTSTMARNAGREPRPLLRLLEKRTLSCHRNWIAVSRYILDITRSEYGIRPNRVQVIHNPIPEVPGLRQALLPADLPESFVLYAGTVSDRKGAFVLAEAARSFLPDHPELHLVYVGTLTGTNGLRADETIRAIVGERLRDRVHFTGPLAHGSVLACMAQAKVFAFPSKLESFGLVPIEAMSCGTPVVYSTLHAGPEIVDDGISGLLADPHDPRDIAEKVLRFLNDSAFAARIAANGKRAVQERFSLPRCIDRTLAFYQNVLTHRN